MKSENTIMLLGGAAFLIFSFLFLSPQKEDNVKPVVPHVVPDDDDTDNSDLVELSKTGKLAKTTAINLTKGYAKVFADLKDKIDNGEVDDGDSFGKTAQKLTSDMLIATFATLDKKSKAIGKSFDEEDAKTFCDDIEQGFLESLKVQAEEDVKKKRKRPHFFSAPLKGPCKNCNCGGFPGCSCSALEECSLGSHR